MGFDWNKYHEVAEHLKYHSIDEEYQRSAISRYYYAYFNIIKNYFENKYYNISHLHNSHQELIDRLNDSIDENEVQLSKYLKQLRGYRNNADYDDEFKIRNIKKTEKAIENIQKILSKFLT